MEHRFRFVTRAAALAAFALFASTGRAGSALESSFMQARAVLARSIEAHGGADRIEKLQAARLKLVGDISTGIQGPRPEAVSESIKEGDFDTTVMIDLAKGRSRTDGDQRGYGGFTFPFSGVYKDGAVLFTQPFPPIMTRTAVADADEGREQTAGIGSRMLPPLLLKLATERLATLRDEGAAIFDGRAVRRISFNADKNTRITLSIDAESSRVVGLEQLAADPLLGLDTTRWSYVGMQKIDGLVLPESAQVQRRGITILKIRLARAEFDAAAKIGDADFAIDPRYALREDRPLEIAQVRPGLWEVSGAQNGNYRMQFVELKDRVVAYDAPVSSATVKAMIAKLREKVPTKPISHVVLSHFHNDHVGGARALAELGAQIVTTADAAPVVQRIARAPEPLASVIDAPAPAVKLITVDSQLDLGEPGRPLIVRTASGSPHVNRLLVLHDVANKAVIASDSYSDVMPFNPTYDWFARWLRGVPDADLMLGAHHPPTPVQAVYARQAAYRHQ